MTALSEAAEALDAGHLELGRVERDRLLPLLQNLEVVTVSLLRFEVRAPLAILTIVVYLFGAVTGGSLFALLRHSVRKL